MKDNKISVELMVPSVGEKYSVFIPVNKTVGEVIVILNTIVNDLNSSFPIKNNLSLLDINNNQICEISTIVKESGIKNGTILALI